MLRSVHNTRSFSAIFSTTFGSLLFLTLLALCSCASGLVISHGKKQKQKFESPKEYCRNSDSLRVDGINRFSMNEVSKAEYVNGSMFTLGAMTGGTTCVIPGVLIGFVMGISECASASDEPCRLFYFFGGPAVSAYFCGDAVGGLIGTQKIELTSIRACNQ